LESLDLEPYRRDIRRKVTRLALTAAAVVIVLVARAWIYLAYLMWSTIPSRSVILLSYFHLVLVPLFAYGFYLIASLGKALAACPAESPGASVGRRLTSGIRSLEHPIRGLTLSLVVFALIVLVSIYYLFIVPAVEHGLY
jgi:hypothetical protein